MKPIVLDKYGALLVNDAAYEEALLFSTNLGKFGAREFIGYHQPCTGKIYIHEHSSTHNVIVCEKCSLRIIIPKEIDDYQKLRKYLRNKIRKNDS